MEFQRLGKNTVQCHLTMEEVGEYGMDVNDLFNDQDKSRDFLEHLMERAEEEVGYEVDGSMISMQLMKLPDDSVVITFSDRSDDSIQGMLSHIQNMVGMIEGGIVEPAAEEETGASEEQISVSDFIQGLQDKVDQHRETVSGTVPGGQTSGSGKKNPDTARLFRFQSLSAVEEFAQSVSIEKNIPSRLYKDEDRGDWYLFIKKGKLRLEEYQKFCQRITEFAGNISRPFAEQYCKEHFRLVIGKQAIKTLREYVS